MCFYFKRGEDREAESTTHVPITRSRTPRLMNERRTVRYGQGPQTSAERTAITYQEQGM